LKTSELVVHLKGVFQRRGLRSSEKRLHGGWVSRCVVHLLFGADVFLARDLLDTILDNVHVVNLLVVDDVLGNLVGSDGLVKHGGMVNQTLCEDRLVSLVVDVQLKVIIHDVLLTAHDLFDRHGPTRLDGERSDVLVQHVRVVRVGGAGGLHRLVAITHGRLDVSFR